MIKIFVLVISDRFFVINLDKHNFMEGPTPKEKIQLERAYALWKKIAPSLKWILIIALGTGIGNIISFPALDWYSNNQSQESSLNSESDSNNAISSDNATCNIAIIPIDSGITTVTDGEFLGMEGYFNTSADDIVDVFEYDRGEPIVKILAYCLMPNHFHLLIEEIKEGGISKFMQKLQTGYTMYFNKKFERSGVLFQGRFKSRHADSGNYARYLFSYVHLNPINNRNIEKPKALNILNIHTFSSLQDYLGEEREQSKIVDTKRFSDLFQNKEAIINELFDWINLPQGPTLRSQSYEI